MTSAATPVYCCRALVKQRRSTGSSFSLHVPTFELHAGEIILLRGASGCGKSTLLDLLALALRPDAAECFVFQPPTTAAPVDLWAHWQRGQYDALASLRRHHLGYILQTGGLLPFLTVRENIGLTARLLGRDATAMIGPLAARLQITVHLDTYPRQLSLGERQRVAIARALAHQPAVILADEPTASLDPRNAQIIRELLLELVRESGTAAVIATHDWDDEPITGVRVLNHRLASTARGTQAYFWT
ncbi:putative ABC transport system ATP-binding protein [Allochromatium warmingii]|uniref:Putative ABC transport system ATP-binding protein n=1 Tax=Allochromatium warmingii TaxID=61595 RepID=A0A1H3FM01_ALLWA|nr:ATP-binding cassette domain-containing protein [Allochromatium warmingii]SDX91408.1 putative ABC transport system ATP-binding protein [Allochromatium warmingii]